MENFARLAGFDDFPLIHDGDAVGDVVDDAEIVGDENHRQSEVLLEGFDEVEDLRLDGDIERGDRFIGDDELGFRGERAGDGDALALAAGELVRVFPHDFGVETDGGHEGFHAVEEGVAFQLRVALADGFSEGGEDRHPRVERGVGVLEDHLEIEPAVADFAAAELGQILAIQDNRAGRRADELHDGPGKGGFSAAGFADEAEDFALFNRQAHPVHGADDVPGGRKHRAALLAEMGVEVFDFQI